MSWKKDLTLIDEWMFYLMGETWADEQSAREKVSRFLLSRVHIGMTEDQRLAVEYEVESCLRRLRDSVTVSLHAVQQFQRRTGSKKRVDVITSRIVRMALRSKRVKPKEKSHRGVQRLLRHRLNEAEFRQVDQWILVINDGEVSTLYEAKGREWEAA